jgi:hypothetical protein
MVNHFAGQAVNLLNRSWAFFMPILLYIGGCLYVDISLCGVEPIICKQRIWQPLFMFAYNISLNAYRYAI